MLGLTVYFSISRSDDKSKNDRIGKGLKEDSPLFLKAATAALPLLAEVRSKSTIDNYRTALRSFSHYLEEDVRVSSIDAHLLEGYQLWLINHQVTQNTISCYMRSLRSLLHHLLPELKQLPTFAAVFTGKMPTDKRSIRLADIVKLHELQLRSHTSLKFSLDMFLFSFYALGMPFVDIAFLKKRQMNDGYIIYHRHKTGQRIRIKIEPPMQQIINRYFQKEGPFVFPILSTENRKKMMIEYENARTRYNRHLKKIGTLAGIRRPLTSYVARHSWASLAFHSNVDISVISKALGHTSPNTTLTYLREIDDHRIDTANHLLLEEVSKALSQINTKG